jgi:hypothetical protein
MKQQFFQAQLIGLVIFGALIISVVSFSMYRSAETDVGQSASVRRDENQTSQLQPGTRRQVERQPVDLNSGKTTVISRDPLIASNDTSQGTNESTSGAQAARRPSSNTGSGSSQPFIGGDEEVDVNSFLSSAEVDGLEFSDALIIDPDTVSLYETMALFLGNLDPATLGLPDEVPFDELQEVTIKALTEGGIDVEILNTAMIKILNEVVKAVLENPELVNIIPGIENLLDYDLNFFGDIEQQITGIVTEELTALFEEVFTEALGELNLEELTEIIKLGDLYPSILSGDALNLGIFTENIPMDIDDLLDFTFGAENPFNLIGEINGIGDINLENLSNLAADQLISAIDIQGLLGLNMSMVGNINLGLITSCGSKHALNWPFRPKWQPGIYTCSMCERRCRLRPFQGFFPIPNVQYSYLWDAWSSRCGCG